MPRLPVSSARRTLLALRSSASRLSATSPRPLSTTAPGFASDSAQDSKPGWDGRKPRDHAVQRPALDTQSEEAQQGIKDHEELKEGSDAISRRDEKKSNKRAKEDHPAAPEPVIGMNSERGSKGN